MIKDKTTDIVRSFVFCGVPLTAENQPERYDGWSPAVEAWLADEDDSSSNGVTTASDFMKSLTAARGQLLGLLQASSSSSAEVTAAQTKYLGLLVELSTVEQQADGDAVLRSTWFDSILPLAAFGPEGSSSNSKWFTTAGRRKPASPTAAAAAAAAVSTSGFAYEAANTLLAVATWKLAKAAALVMSQPGADSAVAMEAYQLYCQAAGVLDELRRKLLPQLGGSTSGDLSRELLSALHLFALGEAQNVMLQRAVALHYQGSTLAPMATDTAMLFCQAYEAIEAAAKAMSLPWNFLPPLASSSSSSTAGSSTTPAKNTRMAGFERVMGAVLPDQWPAEALPLLQLAAYVQYQLGHCYSLASICAAETALSSNQAGQAVALAQLGTNLCEQLADLGFEQSGLIDPVSTLGARDSSRRLALQASLEQKAAHVLARCVRENRTIYFQFVPEHPSALPWPQRSAQPEIYRLPTPQGNLSSSTVKGLMTATAVGSRSSFQAPAAAAVAANGTASAAAAAAAVVIDPPVLDSRRSGSSKVVSPKLTDNTDPYSLANLAEETAAAVAAATAVAAASVANSAALSEDEDASAYENSLAGSGQEEEQEQSAAAAAAVGDVHGAAAEAEAGAEAEATAEKEGADTADTVLSLQLDSNSYSTPAGAAAAKSKSDVSADGGASSPVSSYTLTTGQDIGSTTSTDGSSSSGAGDDGSSVVSRGRRSSSGSSAVSSSSSSSGGGSWEDAASETSRDGSRCVNGPGGLLRGLFGCCLTPHGASLSEDGGSDDESSCDSESEEFEDAWETRSDVSRASNVSSMSKMTKQQPWHPKQQEWAQ